MASIVRIKRSTGVTAPSSLNYGEVGLTVGVGTYGNRGGRLYGNWGLEEGANGSKNYNDNKVILLTD